MEPAMTEGAPSVEEALPSDARAALERARRMPLSYGVRTLVAPDGRVVVALGEAHLKLGAASELGKDVVGSFDLRGVETFQSKRVACGRALWVLIHVPRLVLRAVTLGFVKGSTITDAKQLPSGYTVEIERTDKVPTGLHAGAIYLALFFAVFWSLLALSQVPGLFPTLLAWLTFVAFLLQIHFLAVVPAWLLRRHTWSWLVHPAVAILSVRDRLMAEGTVRMLHDHPGPRAAVVVMGRAHLPGFMRELVERHGFRYAG
jgi:hypothetical protein